jgi:hypothetical protein
LSLYWATSDYGKHLPPYNRAGEWKNVVKETGTNKPLTAKYVPTLSLDEIKAIEMNCVEREGATEIVASRIGHRSVYWQDIGVVIGASKGEQTSFVRVEVTSGCVHGRPITKAELEGEIGNPI